MIDHVALGPRMSDPESEMSDNNCIIDTDSDDDLPLANLVLFRKL